MCGINDPTHTSDEYLVLLAKLGMTAKVFDGILLTTVTSLEVEESSVGTTLG
jgi:hypothetical protein